MNRVRKGMILKLICFFAALTTGTVLAQSIPGQAQDQIQLKLLTDFAFQADNLIESAASRIAIDGNLVYITSPDGYVLRASTLGPETHWEAIFKPKARVINGIFVFDKPGPGCHQVVRFKAAGGGSWTSAAPGRVL